MAKHIIDEIDCIINGINKKNIGYTVQQYNKKMKKINMKRKIILYIENDKVSDLEAVNILQDTIYKGKISENKQGKQYCWASRYEDNTVIENKGRLNNTERFLII